jgi:hypothetical protein
VRAARQALDRGSGAIEFDLALEFARSEVENADG